MKHQCDLCKKETITWDDEERLELDRQWHSDLMFDLCENCKSSTRGLGMIAVARKQARQLAARKSKRPVIAHQPSVVGPNNNSKPN